MTPSPGTGLVIGNGWGWGDGCRDVPEFSAAAGMGSGLLGVTVSTGGSPNG
ncbi:hypothetical protein L3556_06390 [Candidatus Synechococcus calcipolaris G9]|uniref:Uncharacterized protein n=1 Tax=Candidatus Synechococcus calcipolaris G9 TaxID=1497997 RepID=A0ABT6EXN6_9SYNE|nr:hypothetical protein [Candidatus Synechococcus calcipolaris]MDG2990564.1 hypothetical protein [Candidatus Synechococcus calcipolaris G9]